MATIKEKRQANTLGVAYAAIHKKKKYVPTDYLAPPSLGVRESEQGPSMNSTDSGESERKAVSYGPLRDPEAGPVRMDPELPDEEERNGGIMQYWPF